MTKKSTSYVGITLLVLPFVVTFFIGRELLEDSIGQTFGIVVSSFIGALVGFFFYYTLRNGSVALRFSLLVLYILLLVFGWKSIGKNVEDEITFESENMNLIEELTVQGDWFAEEDGVALDMKISKDSIEMIYYPDTVRQFYTYKLEGNTLELKGANLEDEMQWEFSFLGSGDSIKVESEDFVFVLSRQ